MLFNYSCLCYVAVVSPGVREVAEFGPMAGIAGAALALAVWCHQQLKYVSLIL